jgi:MFS family permease
MTFLPVYAARAGALAFQIGLLTIGPAVVNLLFSLPAGRWLEGRLMSLVTFQTSLWNRAGYVAMALLPWLLPQDMQAWALPVIVMLMSIPGTILAISFNAMFADVVPAEWRSHVVGRRNALLAVTSTVASLLCGQLLDRVPYPLNYQLVFMVGVLGAAASSYYLWRIREPRASPPAAQPGPRRFAESPRRVFDLRFRMRGGAAQLLRVDLLRGPFGLMLLAYLAFYTFQYTGIPLMPILWVRELKLSNGAISTGNAIFYAAMLITLMLVGRVSHRIGYHRPMVLAALLFGQYPALNALAQDATLYYVSSALGGIIWAIVGMGLVNRLMERVPEGDRPAHMALHNLCLNLGILLGSALGPALSDGLNIREALYITAALRAVAGLLLALWA